MERGLLERREDMFIREVVHQVIAAAKEARCYKLIATSRHNRERVHKLYRELGFLDRGKEFRIDF